MPLRLGSPVHAGGGLILGEPTYVGNTFLPLAGGIGGGYDSKAPLVEREFRIGATIFTTRVLRWPSFRSKWDDSRARTINIDLANEDKVLNFFLRDKITLNNDCTIKISRDHDTAIHCQSGYSLYVGVNSYDPTAFSFSSWVSIESGSHQFSELGIYQNHTGAGSASPVGNVIELWIDPASNDLKLLTADSADNTTTTMISGNSYELLPGVFHHIGATYSDSYHALYVDGTLISSSTHTNNVPEILHDSNQGRLGWASGASGTRIAFYDTRFFARTITSSEMYDLWEFTSISSTSLVGWYTWDLNYKDRTLAGNNAQPLPDPDQFDFVVGPQVDYAEEYVIFRGKPNVINYSGGKCRLTLTDKFEQLSSRVVGTDDVPVNYLSSNYLPSDIAWWLVTSYGGFDSVESTSNTDIDYQLFSNWASIFSENSVFVQAHFTGQKISECLRKLARITRSAIYINHDINHTKLEFNRFTVINSNAVELANENIFDLSAEIKRASMVNRQYVKANYDIDSDFFNITVVDADSTSINSFGAREEIEEDKNIWYVDSVSALDLAQRIIFTNAEPLESITVKTGLGGIGRLIGETVSITDPQLDLVSGYRILERRINTDTGEITFNGNRSALANPFTLDVSALDSSDILT